MCCSTPRPPQAGHAPNGLLNENSRGSISEMVKPDTGQANFSENMMRWASAAAAVASLVSFADFFSPSPGGGGSDRRWRSGVGCSDVAALAELPPPPPGRFASLPLQGAVKQPSANSTTAVPSASLRAVSKLSARRCAMSRPHHDTVDHHIDVVGELFVEGRNRADLVKRAVDFDALKAFLQVLGEFLAVLALARRAPPARGDRAASLPAAP